MNQTIKFKNTIVAEYLRGIHSYRSLGIKYKIPGRTIWDWVTAYKGRNPNWQRQMYRLREKETGVLKKKLKASQCHFQGFNAASCG